MISIIIPCYNAERFLQQMLDSVLGQTYTDWELICVNDGSTDRTMNILSENELRDSRISVISMNNQGVSAARNIGLNRAKGEYIYFADADDELHKNTLEVLLNAIESHQVDIVKGDYTAIDDRGRQLFVNKKQVIRRRLESKVLDVETFYRQIVWNEFFLWVCLFKSDLIKEKHIRFIPGCRFMEDAAFIVTYLSNCHKTVYISRSVYLYRIYGETAGHNKIDHTTDFLMIENETSTLRNPFLKREFFKTIIKVRFARVGIVNRIENRTDNVILFLRYAICKLMYYLESFFN